MYVVQDDEHDANHSGQMQNYNVLFSRRDNPKRTETHEYVSENKINDLIAWVVDREPCLQFIGIEKVTPPTLDMVTCGGIYGTD